MNLKINVETMGDNEGINTNDISLSLSLLYHLFYQEPNTALIERIVASGMLGLWKSLVQEGQPIIDADLQNERALEQMQADHLALFVGIGMPLAPPWGSVYLSEENLLMQSSTYAWMAHLDQAKLRFNAAEQQPHDHIGLMLSALAQWWHKYQIAKLTGGDAAYYQRALRVTLEQHLLPWLPRFYHHLSQHAQTPLYRLCGKVMMYLIDMIIKEIGAQPRVVTLYY
ncbi:hypothetical protein HGP28_12725 [Vibrio sp. SM6]|uniref:Uncharacterized protein n=1 Tax=Vibrio agarilyticus TaxID=2726741 RepID=A0A7X8TS14_9VIBR|nr:molecular chaperone TorD family protein [Vibrio agarilyticus]NLS13755.1 hypothetical protein [Vibrio agarilyticus]